ncbi:hypothetical protein ACSAZK_17545 [Methanosarcina sp. Mfa9]|uniref:hypothetical protein n=1 Tax=Methanosarcina sp. Mfa9 TaxID=3439063 RepID=UPI003F832915
MIVIKKKKGKKEVGRREKRQKMFEEEEINQKNKSSLKTCKSAKKEINAICKYCLFISLYYSFL